MLSDLVSFSNFNGALISDVLRYARIEPQVLQVELHPYLNQQPLVNFAKTIGLALTAYSSLGPQGYYEIGFDKTVPSILDTDTVKALSAKHNRSTPRSTRLRLFKTERSIIGPAQIVLRWSTQREIAVIPKSNNHDRLVQNLQCNDFDLSEDDIQEINKLNRNLRVSVRDIFRPVPLLTVYFR